MVIEHLLLGGSVCGVCFAVGLVWVGVVCGVDLRRAGLFRFSGSDWCVGLF